MKDITNKDTRRTLIARYLNMEASLAEEKELVCFYLENTEIDEDERAIAKMIRMEHIHNSLLSDEGVQEYERIVNAAKHKTKRIQFKWIAWMGGIAASIALFFAMYPLLTPSSQVSETIEIAQYIQQVMNLDMEDMVSVTATPIDDCVWIQIELKNGSSKIFIMDKSDIKERTSLLAIN